MTWIHSILPLVLVVVIASGCKREERTFVVPSTQAEAVDVVATTDLHAGASTQPITQGPPHPVHNEYEDNAYALSQGQQLFERFNCGTCHASGGGGDIGPPLLDDKWIYGSNPEQVFATIVEGRPNGMPAFRGKLTNQQTWQIAAFVRSLSGMANANAAPGRDEHMQRQPPPHTIPLQNPSTAPSVPNAGKS